MYFLWYRSFSNGDARHAPILLNLEHFKRHYIVNGPNTKPTLTLHFIDSYLSETHLGDLGPSQGAHKTSKLAWNWKTLKRQTSFSKLSRFNSRSLKATKPPSLQGPRRDARSENNFDFTGSYYLLTRGLNKYFWRAAEYTWYYNSMGSRWVHSHGWCNTVFLVCTGLLRGLKKMYARPSTWKCRSHQPPSCENHCHTYPSICAYDTRDLISSAQQELLEGIQVHVATIIMSAWRDHWKGWLSKIIRSPFPNNVTEVRFVL